MRMSRGSGFIRSERSTWATPRKGRLRHRWALRSWAGVALAVAASGSQLAAQTTTGCNNTSRTVQVTGGYQNVFTASCATLSISVAGVSTSTPPECLVGNAFYGGTVYSCQGTAQGLDCNPEGYKVSITLKQGGACPDTSGLNPGSWDSWEDVPEAIAQAMSCVLPSVSETFDWSAKVGRCPGVIHQSSTADSSVPQHAVRVTGVLPMQEMLPASPVDPFASPYKSAQTAALADTHPLLRVAAEASAPWTSADVLAEVTVSHAQPAPSVRRAHITGRIDANGTFSLRETVDGRSPQGEPTTLGRALLCDGRGFLRWDDEAEEGLAWSLSGAEWTRASDIMLLSVAPLHDGLFNPYGIPRFASIEYTSASLPDTGLFLVSRVPSAGTPILAREEYVLQPDGEHARILEKRIFDAAGRMVGQSVFGEFIDGPSRPRPRRIERRLFLGGDATYATPDVTVTVRLLQAVPRAEAEANPIVLPADDTRSWILWP